MPKTNCNPVKLNSIVSYLQRSRVAHNIKDLEKHLPGVASINGMQVKGDQLLSHLGATRYLTGPVDSLQALSNENKINVEKIGSGNWYWSFPSQELKNRQKALEDASSAYDKAKAVVEDLQHKIAEVASQRQEEAEVSEDSIPETHEELVAMKSTLDLEFKALSKELATYSDYDPTGLERKATESNKFRRDVEQYTDDIYAMEGWFKRQGVNEECLSSLRASLYGDQYDPEEHVLKDLA